MQRLVLIIFIAAALTSGYYFLNGKSPSPESTTVEQKPATTDAEARNHINQLTQGSDKAIEIEKADNFVTAQQLLKLPLPSNQALEITSDTPQTPSDAAQESGDETYAVSSHLPAIKSPTTALSADKDLLINISSDNQIKLQELLDNPDQTSESVYFIHAVNNHDKDGLWGIIQHGLMKTFTAGLTLPGQDTAITVDIPQDADEKLANKRSSFLGQILKNKVDKTYIYNYKEGILGDDPNLIKPGQQLIIVTFTEQELMGIYEHFTTL